MAATASDSAVSGICMTNGNTPAAGYGKRAWPVWGDVGWAIADALVTCAQVADLPTLLDLVAERRYGWSRQMIMDALWRFKRDDRVSTLLLQLIDDPDVALHAMGALRRVLGNDDALPHLRRGRDAHPEPRVREQAKQQVRRAESKANR